MQKVSVLLTLTVFTLTLFTFFCSHTPPPDTMTARRALEKAAREEADQWAPDKFQAAEQWMNAALKLIEKGIYDGAGSILAEVVIMADAATLEASESRKKAEQTLTDAVAENPGAAAEPVLKTSHTVRRGETLYIIAGQEDIYRDGEKWPRIYQANRELMEKAFDAYVMYADINMIDREYQSPAQLIYPGWELQIPR